LPFRGRGRGNRFVGRTIDFEKSFADFSETFLSENEVLVQTVFENVAYGSEIEIVT
jgi:hypothetical protein